MTIIDAKASYTMVRSYQSREYLRNDALRKASSSGTGVGDNFCSAFVQRDELVSSLSLISCASDFAMAHVVSHGRSQHRRKKVKCQSTPEKVGCRLGVAWAVRHKLNLVYLFLVTWLLVTTPRVS